MSFDTRRLTAARASDVPSVSTPRSYEDERDLLVELADVLREVGERATVRTPFGAPPRLDVASPDGLISERITTGIRDGRIYARFSWGQELPEDIDQAAAAVRRVINPAG